MAPILSELSETEINALSKSEFLEILANSPEPDDGEVIYTTPDPALRAQVQELLEEDDPPDHSFSRARVRPRTMALSKHRRRKAIQQSARDNADTRLLAEHPKPKTYGECPDGPCPYVSCRHHNYLQADPRTGSIKINFPHLDPLEIPETCSLKAADKGGRTLDVTALLVNLTRERTRQIEVQALTRLRPMLGSAAAEDADPDDPNFDECGTCGRLVPFDPQGVLLCDCPAQNPLDT